LGEIIVEKLGWKPVEEQEVEIVERKGAGHPDHIADDASESVCRALCQMYRDMFGTILHHNVDKGIVVGGRSSPRFGGGEVIEPIYIMVAGRATTEVLSEDGLTLIPVGSAAVEAIRNQLKETFRFLDPDKHVIIDYKIKQGSEDLKKVFELGKEMPRANDTSFGVSFAPLSQTERLVLETELYLNSPELKKELPEVGEDIKVMGLRRGDRIELTIAAAIISSLTDDPDHYMNVKEEIRDRILDLAAKICEHPVEVYVNTADDPEHGAYYITVTGTSAEAGDDGNTGRGNRVHGLITPCRYMSLEATAGKNPVNHVGKIYNVLAMLTSEAIYKEVPGIREVYVKVLSRIGHPIDEPAVVNVQVILDEGYTVDRVRHEIEAIVEDKVGRVRELTDLMLSGKFMMF